MRRSIVTLLAALALFAPATARAGIEKAGTTAAGFLTVGTGADVLGMGGATLGFGSGLGAGAWNVAALGRLEFPEYVFSHASLSGASPQDWIAAGGRFGRAPMRWGFSGLYQGDGTFEGRDASNNPTGSFSASSMALGFQVAQPVGEAAALGLGIKYATEKLGDVTGGGVTFDAGLRVQAGAFGFGAAAQNAFGKMSYGGASYDFPRNYGAGVAYTIPASGVTLAVDANFPEAYYSDVRGGFEWRYRDRLALRTGYRKELGAGDGEPLGGPTFGMGAGANGFWLDYGFLTGGASGSGQHRVALTYHPGFMNGGSEADVVTTPKSAPVAKHVEPKATRIEPARSAKLEPAPKTAKVEPAAAPPKSEPTPAVAKVETAPAPTPKREAPATVSEAPKTPAIAAPVVLPSVPKPAVATRPAVEATKPVVEAPRPAAPVKVEKPVETAPATKTEPTPAKVEAAPARIEKPAEPAKGEPAKSEPAKVEPAKVEPAKSEPAKVEPPAVAKPAAPAPSPEPVKQVPPAKETPRPNKVKVKSGETLADIARQWKVSVASLMMENNLVSDSVKPGQTLKLPPKGR